MRIMKRREFILGAAAAGLSMASSSALAIGSDASKSRNDLLRVPRRRGKTVAALRTDPLERVRVGFIGMGARGPTHLAHCLVLEGVEVVAVCDTHIPSAEKGRKMCTDAGKPAPVLYTNGPDDYKRMLQRDDIDVVYISTPWEDHTRMAIDTMRSGKHALVEVPLAYTVEDLWAIVDVAEETQRHCMMLENVNYGREELLVLHMCRLGLFGELLHGEAAYIHDLRWQMKEIEHGTGSWRTYHYTKRNGNLYPTHGLGPVAHYMNINRGDRLDFMTSVSSPARARAEYARAEFPAGHERRSLKFVCGDINTTICKTVKGKTLMIQWDEQLPRPYTRHNLIQGSRGVWAGFPGRVVIEGQTESTESWVQGSALGEWYEKYDHPLWKKLAEEAVRNGGHGGMDFIMNWRIMTCLRNGEPLDQDVYDGAIWSVIGPLSEWSIANRGQSIDVPDFTRGEWRTMAPLGIVS